MGSRRDPEVEGRNVERSHHAFRRTAGVAAALLTLVGAGIVTPRSSAQAAAACQQRQGPVGPAFVDCSGGQVFNIVPPGATGTYDLADFQRASQGKGFPPNTRNQEPLYANLVRVAPNLSASLISSYFKDASFATDMSLPGTRVETFKTHPGTVVFRYKNYGVPHVYGVTRADTEFGSGYASAEDRLFMMDVLRHTGRAQLTAFIGPSASNEAMDCSVSASAGYSEAELQQQINDFPANHPAFIPGTSVREGDQVVADANAYVAGVNQYISDAMAGRNGAKMPVEYQLLNIALKPWKPTDVVATATLVQAIFATGGGNEVASALLYQSLVSRYGATEGAAIWSDLRSQNDPDAQVSIPTTFNYEHVPAAVDPNSLAMPIAPPTNTRCTASGASAAARSSASGILVDLSALLGELQHRGVPQASNELIVDAAHSATGHPIAVFGPQTGYDVPQLLHEVDLHGPGMQARGVSFAGTEVYVELGHGEDYAWSATSAGSDIIDERLEKLCNTDGSPATMSSTAYVYNGTCTPMYERTDKEYGKPPSSPLLFTIQIERTVHGPVIGRTTAVDPTTGKTIPVAVSSQRSTFGDELGSTPAFLEWNDPDVIHGALDFQRAAGKETGTFNYTYVDSKNVAYYSSGKLPIRNPHVNPNFPTWGTGQWEWQGFVPSDLSAADVHPRASTAPPASGVVNGTFRNGFFTNWNNKQSPGFSAADSNFAYGPVYRVQSLSDRVQAVLNKGPATPVAIINAMEDAATVDLDGAQLVNQMAAVLKGAALTTQQQSVLGTLQTWAQDSFWGAGVPGAHRRDRSVTGAYEQGNAVTVMADLYPRLTHAVFDPWLNTSQYSLLAGINPINNEPAARGSAYDGGWEGYLQRAMLQALGTAAHPSSQSYCGSGSLATCQTALQNALQASISALTTLYGSSNPATWTCARSNPTGGRAAGSGQTTGVECNPAFDDIQYSAIGVGTVPAMPWVNRPTFQQVVQFPAGR